ELLLRELQLGPTEFHVVDAVDGDQVDVRVRHFQADDRYTDACTGHHRLDLASHFLGKGQHARKELIGQVEEVVHLHLWDHQRVTLAQRVDVEEGQVAFVLGYFVAGYLPLHDAGEDACHQRLISTTSKRV